MPMMSLRSDIDVLLDEHVARCPGHDSLWMTEERAASLQGVLDKIEYKDWRFVLERNGRKVRFQIQTTMKDSLSDAMMSNNSRAIDLCPNMSNGLVVDLVFEMVKEFELHEAAEHYLVGGRRVYFPHDQQGVPVRFVRAQR